MTTMRFWGLFPQGWSNSIRKCCMSSAFLKSRWLPTSLQCGFAWSMILVMGNPKQLCNRGLWFTCWSQGHIHRQTLSTARRSSTWWKMVFCLLETLVFQHKEMSVRERCRLAHSRLGVLAEGRTEVCCNQRQDCGQDHSLGSFHRWTLRSSVWWRHPSNKGSDITPGGHVSGMGVLFKGKCKHYWVEYHWTYGHSDYEAFLQFILYIFLNSK